MGTNYYVVGPNTPVLRTTPRGSKWTMWQRVDGSAVLAWQFDTPSGVARGSIEWDQVSDIPDDLDPETTVEKERDAHEPKDAIVGQGSSIRRLHLWWGWRAYLMRFWGPPTWRLPRFGLKIRRGRVEVRVGWLQHGFALSVAWREVRGG